MLHGILGERLQEKPRDQGASRVDARVDAPAKPIAESNLLDREVARDEGQLVLEADRLVRVVEDVAQEVGEPGQHRRRLVSRTTSDERHCRVQGVEQEVRADLCLERR